MSDVNRWLDIPRMSQQVFNANLFTEARASVYYFNASNAQQSLPI